MTIGRVLANGRDKGSGFVLATPGSGPFNVVVTANHVVRDQEIASLQFCTYMGRKIGIKRIEQDEALDIAVLYLDEMVDEGLAVGNAVKGGRWRVETQPQENDPQLTGSITTIRQSLTNSKKHKTLFALQLLVEQDLGSYAGYSGSPVVLQSPSGGVIGVLIEELGSRFTNGMPLGQTKPATNVLYATPIQAVLDRFGLTARWVVPLEELTCLPGQYIHYFSLLAPFLEGEGQAFQHELEQETIYVPEHEYFEKIQQALTTHRRVLLMGQVAAGKTTLALTLSRHMQETAGYTICYKDIKYAQTGDGRMWYALMREHDRPGLLYILDNGHLSPEEVEEFCLQWQTQPPTYTQCLLISRTTHGKEQQQTDREEQGYVRRFSAEEKILVHSEAIFAQVIDQYLQFRLSRLPNPVKNDVAWPGEKRDTAMKWLEKQHAHNLVVSRCFLEAWWKLYEQGTCLPLYDVKLQEVYQTLIKEYRLLDRSSAFESLCVLQRYDIPVHASYVLSVLEQQEIEQLRTEKLLRSFMVDGYGHHYDLLVHSEVARELFFAFLYVGFGRVRRAKITVRTEEVLEAYLRSNPPSFMLVYDQLVRYKQDNILKRLLQNPELQKITASQFDEENVSDAIRYAARVAKIEAVSAKALLDQLVHLVEIDGIATLLVKKTWQENTLLFQALCTIDRLVAVRVVEALGLEQLLQSAHAETLQSLFTLLRTLQGLAPARAQMLLDALFHEVLIAKTTLRNLKYCLEQLQQCQYPTEKLTNFLASLDLFQLAQQHEGLNIHELVWTLHALRRVAPLQAQTLVQHIPLSVWASKARTSLMALDLIVHTLLRLGYQREDVRAFVALLTVEDYARLFDESSLNHVGKFLHRQYGHLHVRTGYQLFYEQSLSHRLALDPLDEIIALLNGLSARRREGTRLVYDVVARFMRVNAMTMAERMASANLLQVTRLLQHAHTVKRAQMLPLLDFLRETTVLQMYLSASGINTLQRFIYEGGHHYAADLQEAIKDALILVDIRAQLVMAPVREIGFFLWNVYCIDQHTAREESLYVDQHLSEQRLLTTSPEDVCHLLWNMVSMSKHTSFRLCDAALLQSLVHHGWHKEYGWIAVLTGIMAMLPIPLLPENTLELLPISEEAKAYWSRWLTSGEGRNPYFLALALQGLRVQNEEAARILLSQVLPVDEILPQLRAAWTVAQTERSKNLLKEIVQWLEYLLEKRKA